LHDFFLLHPLLLLLLISTPSLILLRLWLILAHCSIPSRHFFCFTTSYNKVLVYLLLRCCDIHRCSKTQSGMRKKRDQKATTDEKTAKPKDVVTIVVATKLFNKRTSWRTLTQQTYRTLKGRFCCFPSIVYIPQHGCCSCPLELKMDYQLEHSP
jgi:hypothetical protein